MNSHRINFGKHRGRTCDELNKTDVGRNYLAWAYDSYKQMPEAMRQEIAGLLGVQYGPRALPIIDRQQKESKGPNNIGPMDTPYEHTDDDIPF